MKSKFTQSDDIANFLPHASNTYWIPAGATVNVAIYFLIIKQVYILQTNIAGYLFCHRFLGEIQINHN
jgi:hypothetical protein